MLASSDCFGAREGFRINSWSAIRGMTMRKGSMIFSVAVSVLLTCAVSCAQLANMPSTTTPGTGTGSFSYTISPFNPVVSKAFALAQLYDTTARGNSNARAFMAAAKVRFEVLGPWVMDANYNYSQTKIDSWTIYPAIYPSSDGATTKATVLGTRSIPAGTGYYLNVYVYNDPSAADSDYSVQGNAYFSIVDGQLGSDNLINVTCYPNWNLIKSLRQSTDSESYTQTNTWAFDSKGEPTSFGSETWFYAYPTYSGDPIKVTVIPDLGSKAIPWVFVFDQSTNAIAKLSNGKDAIGVAAAAGSSATIEGLVPSSNMGGTAMMSNYYICVIDVGSASDSNRSYKVKYNSVVTIPTNPISVSPSIQDYASIQPSSWVDGDITSNTSPVWYYIDTIPGKTYSLWLNKYSQYYDTNSGNNSKTAEIMASAYTKDFSASYFIREGQWQGFYTNGKPFVAAEDKIYIKIEPTNSSSGQNALGTGSFALAMTTDSNTWGSSVDSNGWGYVSGNEWRGSKYTVGAASTILKFGFFPKASEYYDYNLGKSVPIHVKFALYKANSSANYDYGTDWLETSYNDGPGDLVAYTDSVALTTSYERVEISLSPNSGATVAAGDYWIVMSSDARLSVGSSYADDKKQAYSSATYDNIAPPATFAANGNSYVYPPQYSRYDFYIKTRP